MAHIYFFEFTPLYGHYYFDRNGKVRFPEFTTNWPIFPFLTENGGIKSGTYAEGTELSLPETRPGPLRQVKFTTKTAFSPDLTEIPEKGFSVFSQISVFRPICRKKRKSVPENETKAGRFSENSLRFRAPPAPKAGKHKKARRKG